MARLLKSEVRTPVAILTLDDPARRNALSLELATELDAALSELARDPEVGALVVTGAPPAFSAGADLDDLERASPERLRAIYRGFLAVAEFPRPTIAAVNGAAVGAGLNLALACDLRLAAESARFESRFIELALHPGGGHGWMLTRLLGSQGAAAVALYGETLDGAAAARHGLAWRCVPDDALLEEALRLAANAGRTPRELGRRVKATLQASAHLPSHEEAVALELAAQLWSVDQPEFRERIAAIRRKIAGRRG